MINCVVFDFDGVIIDSHDVQIMALTKSFREIVGVGEPPVEDFFKHSGNSLENIFIKLGLPLEMIPVYRLVSSENIKSIKIHTGMRELLDELSEKNINCSLCTGKERKRTMEILTCLDLEKYFRVIVCSDDVKNPKPDPESLINIIKALKTTSDEMVMVGDGINDILAAKRLQIASIAVTWGDCSKEMLRRHSPDYLCDRVFDLRNILIKEGGE